MPMQIVRTAAHRAHPQRFAAALIIGALVVVAGSLSVSTPASLRAADNAGAPQAEADRVSYHRDVRPIFAAHCQGCHQPAKADGGFVMTLFDRLVKGGESEQAAVVPGKPADSYLIDQITPQNGEAAMPKGKAPLPPEQIALISKWIAQGAVDDTPANARERYDAEHPPVYTRPPIIGTLDYSPDGQLLAVGGFHEVLLLKADGSELTARLVGMAERIESVRFSPDGSRLLVTGGLPGRTGEVQIWDVASRRLLLSVPVTYDTVYGGSWSPDGKLAAFGCGDNSVRAIDAETGEPVLFQGAHSDWALDTVFSADGSHLVSVGRDMAVKLTELATQRFVDNVTSITPGALKGGVSTVARHPERDEIVIGGSDGVVKAYRIHRLTKRVIGDDANLIRKMPPMRGRVFGVAVSRDGRRIAAVSSLNGQGQLHIYGYEFDTSLPAEIKAINEKTVQSRSAAEKETLEKHHSEGVQLIASVDLPQAAAYAVAFRPDSQAVAVSGADGIVRIVDAASGSITTQFAPAPITAGAAAGMMAELMAMASPARSLELPSEKLPDGVKLTGLTVEPTEIRLTDKFAYVQLVATGALSNGDSVDVTRLVQARPTGDLVEISPTGLVTARADGSGTLELSLAGQKVVLPVAVAGVESGRAVDFISDVNPVLSRLGCNQGTCHGAAAGKNGFKLSLRGYDPLFDIRALTDDHAARRVNLAAPDSSLMLLKATGSVPHAGGALIAPGDPYYEIIRTWIAGGARLDLKAPRVTRIDVSPLNPVVQQVGTLQQLRVLATYSNGRVQDVTREAFLESGDNDVATAARGGLMTALRRGEAPMLARYEGSYAATTLTVMGDREGFAWEQPETWGRIDELTAEKWRRMKILPSGLAGDADFLRRVYLDLTGLPPTADETRAFLADDRPTRVKRDEVVDRLVGSEAYVDYWTNKWADLLQVNRKFLAPEGAAAFRKWIHDEVAQNTPYDQFARKVLLASGSNRENPPASYYKILREPTEMMENTTHLFLAVRFNCNKCHDHPFERWTQDQYYETAAYFARVGLKGDPASGGRNIGGTAVEGAKPLYEIILDSGKGEVVHERTGEPVAPKFPFDCDLPAAGAGTAESSDPALAADERRRNLAAWITSPDNPYFARSYVNRQWGYMFGVGIMEPIDDLRAGNPPTNPELLDYLVEEFLNSGFDSRHIHRLIAKSRTYQLSIEANAWNADDKTNYSHATARRLPAEVLYDAVHTVTGTVSRFPGIPAGTRAAALPDSGVELPSGFLSKFGRPVRESACECERSSGLQLGPVMALVSGPTVADAIADGNNELTKLVASQPDDHKLIDEIFLRILNRPATEAEIAAVLASMNEIDADHAALAEAVKKRQAEVDALRGEQEAARELAILEAQTTLSAYEKEIAPRLAEQEQQRVAKVTQLEQQLAKYEEGIPAKLEAWVKQQSEQPTWTTLTATEMKASTGAALTAEPDGVILAEAKKGVVVYTLTVPLEMRDVTGFRLEALADPRLPASGPGLSANGNFVLTEFEIQIAPASDPAKKEPVKLKSALADFNQANYAIATSIDGARPRQNNGWAVSGATGKSHWATFETEKPIGFEGGAILTILLDQRYADDTHALGKFRIAATTAKRPIGLSFPGEVAPLLALDPEQRTAEQSSALLGFYRGQDAELQKIETALAAARQPLPIDPKLKQLRDELASVSQPIPPDPKLTRLQGDLQMSQQQMANKRLTAAQDLAWALINSPAFLFNR